MIKADQYFCSVVSLLDDVGVLLVLQGLSVDGGPGEGVIGVPDQAHRVDGPLHLKTQILGQRREKTLFSNFI